MDMRFLSLNNFAKLLHLCVILTLCLNLCKKRFMFSLNHLLLLICCFAFVEFMTKFSTKNNFCSQRQTATEIKIVNSFFM